MSSFFIFITACYASVIRMFIIFRFTSFVRIKEIPENVSDQRGCPNLNIKVTIMVRFLIWYLTLKFCWVIIGKKRMTTFIKTKFNKSDDRTNIDKYREAANITEYHIIYSIFINYIKMSILQLTLISKSKILLLWYEGTKNLKYIINLKTKMLKLFYYLITSLINSN